MSFDWMHAHVPDFIVDRNRSHQRKMHEDEVRVRAALLRRLGHAQEQALHRCLGNEQWAFEMKGASPLTEQDIRAIVEGVYKR